MKILFTTRYFGGKDGVGRYSVETAKRLMEKHDVTVLTSKADVIIPGLHYRFIKIPTKPFLLWEILFTIKSSWFVRKSKSEFDIVHTQKTETLGGDIVTMHSCHAAGVDTRNSQDGSFIKKIVRKLWPLNILRLFVEKKVLKNSKVVAAVSTGVKNEIQKFYKRKNTDVVFNGVDEKVFSPGETDVRMKYGISIDAKLLLFVGNGYKSKGLNFVLDAMHFLGKEYHLLIVGRDDWEPAAENITVEKYANPDEMHTYYKAADCFVFPSLYEAFPLVVLEALSSGVPVVASRVNGVTDCMENGVNGHIVERNGADVAFGVKKIFRDKDTEDKYKKMSRESSLSFTWDKSLVKLEELYESINNNTNTK